MVSSYDLNVGAKRLEKVEPSLIRTVLDRTAVLRGEGKPVIAFSAGEPDFNTPSDIKEATIRAITNNQTKYGSNQGYPPLRKLLQGYIKEETGIDYDPNTEILITSSAATGDQSKICQRVGSFAINSRRMGVRRGSTTLRSSSVQRLAAGRSQDSST